MRIPSQPPSLAPIVRLPRVFAVVGAAALAACTRSSQPDAAQVVADPALQRILQHVPADTPYAFVSMGGSGTREFITKLYAPMQKLMPQVEGIFDTLGLDEPTTRLPRAIYHELKDKFSADGLAQLGLDVDARFAMYGLGVLPAMRLQLRDPAALRAAIERVQTAAGVRFPTGKLGDVEYWHIAGDKIEGAVAILGDHLVAGVAPVAHKDRVFGLLLGRELPAQHLGGSERFAQLLAEYSLARVSAGYVDNRLLAEAFLGEGDALNRDVLAALSPEVAALSPGLDATCKQELRSLVALAPRLVFGTEQIDRDGFSGKFILELRPDLAQELMAMRASVPGLEPEAMSRAVFGLGFGLDLDRALKFAQASASAVQAAPYRCPALAELNQAAGAAVGAIQGLDPEVWKLRGFAAALDDLKLVGFFPTEPRGFVSLGFTDTKALISRLAPLMPQALDDGAAHAVPNGTIPFINDAYYGLQSGRGGAFALGADAEARVKALLAEPVQTDPPLLVMIYDMGRVVDLSTQAMGATGGAMPDTMSTVIDMYRAFGIVRYDARASERGLVLHTRMALR